MKNENYREKFKKHYGIVVDGTKYHIHHIDLNHDNNSIDNLMILPADLHKSYHDALNKVHSFTTAFNGNSKIFRKFDCRITGNEFNYLSVQHEAFWQLCMVLIQCADWYDYKMFLDGKLSNIHHITLD